MSYRIEEKIPVSHYEASLILREIIDRGAENLYPARMIASTYFDTYEKAVFRDSEEGLLPRKKVRIRHYPDATQKRYNLEIKISSVEGRFKTSRELDAREYEDILQNGYFDELYGPLYPAVDVAYRREYYIFHGVRITFDSAIEYSDFQRNGIIEREPLSVVELKAPSYASEDLLRSVIEAPRRRFSKFSNAINLLGKY